MYRPLDEASYERHPRLAYIAEQLGTRAWVVAHRLSPRLKREGYERAVSSKQLQEIERQYAHDNPDEARDRYRGEGLHELHVSEDELGAVRAALRLYRASARPSSLPTIDGALRAVAKISPEMPPVQIGIAA